MRSRTQPKPRPRRTPEGRRRWRRGLILPLVTLTLVALCGFLALAVDIGIISTAKARCQDAADAASLAGARTFDGSTVQNLSLATSNAQGAITNNNLPSTLAAAYTSSIQHGSYSYNSSSQTFGFQTSIPSGENYNATRATVSSTAKLTLANVLGVSSRSVTATAVAAHRPRDIAIILDFSGSMNDVADVWNAASGGFMGSLNGTSNNRDTQFPRFGHYSAVSTAALECTSTDARVGYSNVTQAANGLPCLADDYYQHNRGSAANKAFIAAPSTFQTAPAGDLPLTTNGNSTTTYAQTFQLINNNSTTRNASWESSGYDLYYASKGKTFQGYTIGPRYWGATFFTWPPDPRINATNSAQSKDWRHRFFGTQDNTKLWDTSGNWRTPTGNYTINYKNILAWIKEVNAENPTNPPFPPQLRAGRITYYDAIPDDVPTSAYTWTNSNSSITNSNQRFWKEYIDYTLGVWRDLSGNVQTPGSGTCSYGPDYTWGTIRISTKPATQFMDYRDNPERPRHRMWFGATTMIQYLLDTNRSPGTSSEPSMYPMKLGISAALTDIKNNHPNDLVSLIFFNRPQFNGEPANYGANNVAKYSLSRDYSGMIDALWYPPNSGTTDVRVFDANDHNTPRAWNDYSSNTATSYGLMLAYNELSGSSAVRAANAGGKGRKGVKRLVILETDGMANVETSVSGGFVNGGADNSYYSILPGQTVSNGSFSTAGVYRVAQAIANKSDGTAGNSPGYSPNPGVAGFSSNRKKVTIHTLAFGSLFEAAAAGTDQNNAVALLQQISSIGGTTFPSSSGDAANGYKWIIGTMAQRETKMRTALSKVTDDGASVALIQ